MTLFYSNVKTFSQLAFRYGFTVALSIAALLSTSASASAYQANSNSPDSASNKPALNKASDQLSNVTADRVKQKKLPESRIAELRAFANAHHPEIMPLINFLEAKRTKKFHKVIKSLNRDVSNLERLRKKSPDAYERGLAIWINSSKIQLYAAQFKVANDDATADELREKIRLLLEENLDTQVMQIERDIVTTQEKAARLQKALEDIKANRNTMIKKRIEAATKRAPKMNTGENLKKADAREPVATPDK